MRKIKKDSRNIDSKEKIYILNDNMILYKLSYNIHSETFFWDSLDDSQYSITDLTIYNSEQDIFNDIFNLNNNDYEILEFDCLYDFCTWYIEIVEKEIDKDRFEIMKELDL